MINTLGLLSLVLSAVITAQPLDNPAITPLSTTEVNDFNSYTYFASAAYSPPSEIDTWSCGGKSSAYLKVTLNNPFNKPEAACRNNSDFKYVASGGNGDTIQYCASSLCPCQNGA